MKVFNEDNLREYLISHRHCVCLREDGVELYITGKSLRNTFDFGGKYKGTLHKKFKPMVEAIGWEFIGSSGTRADEHYHIKLIEDDVDYKKLNEADKEFGWYASFINYWESMTYLTPETFDNFCKETVWEYHGLTEEVLREAEKLLDYRRLLGGWWKMEDE